MSLPCSLRASGGNACAPTTPSAASASMNPAAAAAARQTQRDGQRRRWARITVSWLPGVPVRNGLDMLPVPLHKRPDVLPDPPHHPHGH